ncbi:MAG: SPASM domain-containing protein [Oligoflexia bacterium]|nr:SPASM domain-containing protein [Oligoflexia bacterium]
MRFNLLGETPDEVAKVFEEFGEIEREHVLLYFRSIYSTDSFKREDRTDLLPFYQMAKSKGMGIYENFSQNYSYCEGDLGVTINPDLSVWKCNHDLDQIDKKVGEISTIGELVTNPRYDEILEKINPFSDPRCLECLYLPICFGGCHFDYLNKGHRSCLLDKQNSKQIVEFFLPSLVQVKN